MKIELCTRLAAGIYASSGGGVVRVHDTWAVGPINLRKAVKRLASHRKEMVERFGNLGCGSSWLRMGGRRIDNADIEYYSESEDGLTIPSAKVLLAEHTAAIEESRATDAHRAAC
jgi:hypothetical protein